MRKLEPEWSTLSHSADDEDDDDEGGAGTEWTPLEGTAAMSALPLGATAGEDGCNGLGDATCALLALMGVLDWRRWVGVDDEADGTAAAAEEPEERGSREWPCGGSPLLTSGGVEGAEDEEDEDEEEAEEDEPKPNTRRNIRAGARRGEERRGGGGCAGEEGAPTTAAAVSPLPAQPPLDVQADRPSPARPPSRNRVIKCSAPV